MVMESIAEGGGEDTEETSVANDELAFSSPCASRSSPERLSPERSTFIDHPCETMNGDASAGPAAHAKVPYTKIPTEMDEDVSAAEESQEESQDDDSLLMPEDEVDHVCVGQSRSVLPMSGQLCGVAFAKEFIGGSTTRTLVLADDPDCPEEAPPDDEMEHTGPQSSECLRNGLEAIGCEGRYKIDLDSAAPCPMRPAGPLLRSPKPEGQTSDEKFLAPCPGMSKDDKDKKDDNQKADTRTSPRPNKKRTWKYYPPPSNDTDLVPIDVIDHESEVLIIRREPPPPPKGTSTVAASSFCQS